VPAYRDPGLVEFDAVISTNEGGGSWVAFPIDSVELFGAKGRVPVIATFDGVEYRGSLMPYGGVRMIGLLKRVLDRIGKTTGDTVHVTLRLDATERTIELDDATEAAFADAGVLDAYRAFSYSHQREFWHWIDSAKKAETRETRTAKSIEMIRDGSRLR
jgi:hypothetical protein